MLRIATYSQPTARRIALIVANKHYRYLEPLKNPDVDAVLVATALREIGFEVEVLNDLECQQLRDAVLAFHEKCQSVDAGIFYFAGHGVQSHSSSYVLPVDARLKSAMHVGLEGISDEWLLFSLSGVINHSKALRLVVLDACRSLLPLNENGPDPSTLGIRGGLYPSRPILGDVAVCYSAAAGQVAQDGAQGAASPFAQALATHIRSSPVDIQRLLGLVRDDVMKLTGGNQQPYVYSSFGGEHIYLKHPGSTPQGSGLERAIDVDLLVANTNEYYLQEDMAAAGESSSLSYRYFYAEEDDVYSLYIYPDIDYIHRFIDARRPIIISNMVGSYNPEIITWGGGYPMLEILIRRASRNDVVISEILFEVHESRPDFTPYVDARSISDQFCTVTFFNEGWAGVDRLELEYEVLGFQPPVIDEPAQYAEDVVATSYQRRLTIPGFDKHQTVSFEPELMASIDSLNVYRFLFDNYWKSKLVHPELDLQARLEAILNTIDPVDRPIDPRKIADWLADRGLTDATASVRGHDNAGRLWIQGRLTSVPTRAGVRPLVSAFVAPLAVFPPEGLGGGSIEVDLKTSIELLADGKNYLRRRGIGYLLDEQVTTFRGLFTLSGPMSSRHILSVVVKGNGGRELYRSRNVALNMIVPYTSVVDTEVKNQQL